MPRFERAMARAEQERLIVLYRGRGWSFQKIADAVGMSKNGVFEAWRRLSRPAGFDFDED